MKYLVFILFLAACSQVRECTPVVGIWRFSTATLAFNSNGSFEEADKGGNVFYGTWKATNDFSGQVTITWEQPASIRTTTYQFSEAEDCRSINFSNAKNQY